MAEETYTNRLTKEKSPYLLQHAHNPVDWFPWGEEAFRKARTEHKPIFLSIGYSTCHWCHVMEEESFVNPEIAKILNEHFVSIKVDREERPDVDHIYMQAVMAMTGAGGWPMSVFLTPDLKPFYGGTYFPPTDKWGKPGLPTVLNAVADQWASRNEALVKTGDKLTKAIQAEATGGIREILPLDEDTLKKTYEQLESRYDEERGGFGDAPKFPQSHMLSCLLRYWKRMKNEKKDDDQPLKMVEKTLQEMAKGGMHDQLGGGFHRYSVDESWRVPHFEKMLYDQALLAKTYLEAYQATGNDVYAQTARDIFSYVLRDMRDPKGGFYSAEDADSAPNPTEPQKKSEGACYLWSYDEIVSVLGPENAGIFNHCFGVEKNGNAPSDPQGEFGEKNILYVNDSPNDAAKKFNKTDEQINLIIQESKTKLLKIRAGRPRPHLDDKILADWNGLMISSLAVGSRVLDEPRYREAAKKAADFILENMVVKRRLMHRYRDGEVAVGGFLEDYAFMSHGLIDLYEATFDPKYLEEAQWLIGEMIRLFWDESSGGFFFTANDTETPLTRAKEHYDGAVPSGNSVAALSLLRISRITMNKEFEELAHKTFQVFSSSLNRYPTMYTQMMIALNFALGPSYEVVIAGEPNDPRMKDVIREIYVRFIPNKVVVLHPNTGPVAQKIEGLSPFVKPQVALDGKLTVYVCRNYVCQLPATDIPQLVTLLES